MLTRCISMIMTTTISTRANPTNIKRLFGVARLWSPSLLFVLRIVSFSCLKYLGISFKYGSAKLFLKIEMQAFKLIIYPVIPDKVGGAKLPFINRINFIQERKRNFLCFLVWSLSRKNVSGTSFSLDCGPLLWSKVELKWWNVIL